MANAEVAETASTGSKRSRGSEALVSARPAKKTKGATQSGGSSDRPSRRSSTTTDAEIQLGGYALEMLGSTRGTRMHNIGVIFRDELISLWYFDASGIVRTCPDAGVNREKLSLITNFEQVAAIFVALAYCDAEQFGAIPAHVITPPTTKPHPSAFPIRCLKEHTIDLSTDEDKEKNVPFIVTLGKHIYSQYALVGRRTTIYEGTTSAAGGGRVIVKVSQQYVKRTSEFDLVEHARKLGIEHVPEFLKSKDLWYLSSGIRKLFATAPDPDNDRVLRCLVMDRYTPLSEKLVQAPDSLMEMAKQLITCIRDLRYKGLILHRDISEGNIMYQNRHGEDRFILIDFDLAVFVDENGFPKGATSRHRTGTLPFMARQLIEDMEGMDSQREGVIHCVRHDYESVFWVTLWCAIKIADPNSPDDYAKARNAELATWEFGTYEQIAAKKLVVLTHDIKFKSRPLSPLFEHLRGWLMAFKRPFASSAMSEMTRIQSQEELKDSFQSFETSSGLVTYEKLLTTFEGI
ncbi:hypothetical protein BC835DRAFT_45077 [Cytidiella melzeri]|nr:hypothetical protein BC835DRAFT_45077 [Cytidiella melzeri]